MSDNIESRLWVLGAPDPEMEAIERLLRECGETVVYAADARGERVTPGAAYRGESLVTDVGNHPCTSGVTTVYLVECELLTLGEDICHPVLAGRTVRRIDHHRPGDPGYGRPPSEFFAASSIGQVCAVLGCAVLFAHRDDACRELSEEEGAHGWHYAWSGLGQPLSAIGGPFGPPVRPGANRWTTGKYGLWDGMPLPDRRDFSLDPGEAMLIAAADHCLGDAYRGECPGVDPDALMHWRAESRAKFQGRTVVEVLADVARAREALRRAPLVSFGGELAVRDMREAYTVSTVLVVPFTEGATVDAAGVGDSASIEFGPRHEGAWDEGGHHTFVRRGVPELPDAASREGVAYLAYVDRDGGRRCRPKVVLGGCTTPEMVRAFLDHWAPSQGLVDAYGDPARGFAGAYLTTETP